MSSIHLIAIETALFLATLAVFGWFADKAKVGGLQVYRGAADGIRMSRRTRRLWLIYVYGGYIALTGFTPTLVALALLQVGVSAGSAEAANTAYLFAAMLVGAGGYMLITGAMMVFGLAKMIERGQRGEPE